MAKNNRSLRGAIDLGGLNTARTANGALSRSDRFDLFRFKLAKRSSFSVALNNLSANANLSLLNRSGKAIAASKQPGQGAESIATTLAPGVYYLRVNAAGKGNPRYTLTSSAAPTFSPTPTPSPTPSLFAGRDYTKMYLLGTAALDDYYRGGGYNALDRYNQVQYTLTTWTAQGDSQANDVLAYLLKYEGELAAIDLIG